MMVVTSVPAFAINASAAENTKYLFAYFTGDTVDGQKIRFATSSDGKNFRTLNNGNYTVTQKPVLNALVIRICFTPRKKIVIIF